MRKSAEIIIGFCILVGLVIPLLTIASAWAGYGIFSLMMAFKSWGLLP